MQNQTSMCCARLQAGRLLIALPALIALAACSGATPPPTANASGSAVQVAGGNSGNGSAHSVNAVSDALGQRLDGMLSTRPAGAGANR